MRTKIVAGNWKMNTVVSEGKELVDGILSKLSTVPSDVQLIVAPPFTHLSEVASKLAGSSIALAAQNCADH
ncbi:MAG: triose-phosphate isomerase, partial [Bacteroidales bacterium]|nr:triose-phosphate isomerase [Bacteroidales bacterium]